jgi:uncharacterized lipoprotein YddW (UPF0748 family)
MNRRTFLAALGAGAAATGLGGFGDSSSLVEGAQATVRRGTKNWAWMRGAVKSMDEWKQKLARLKAAGIGAILINGDADFYRSAAPAAASEGLELHAWIFTMMRGEHVKEHPDWYAVSRSGNSTADKPPYVPYYKFMCPSHDGVRSFLAGYVREIAAVDGLAGVHLDYIRYPDVILPVALWPKYNLVQDKEYPDFDFCYCALCRERFNRQSGIDPRDLADPFANRAWLQYRYDTITAVVALLAGEVHTRQRKLTAAVFPTPAIARALVRQDWTKWKVDAVLPMTYHAFYKKDVAWIEQATREGVVALARRIPLYSGLYVPDLPPDDLGRAVDRAFAGGAMGVSVFQGDTLTPAHLDALRAALSRAGTRA